MSSTARRLRPPRGRTALRTKNFVPLELRCSALRAVNGAQAANITLPHSVLPWGSGLCPYLLRHKPSAPPTHLSFLPVWPSAPRHGCKSQSCSSLRPRQPLEAQKREERTVKGLHSRGFQLLVLPGKMPVRELNYQQ